MIRRVAPLALLIVALFGGGVVTALPASAADDAQITVHVSAHRQVGDGLQVSGDLTSASQPIVYPATVTFERDHSAEMTMQATDANGHFVIDDIPDTRGSVTYTVSWPGDVGHPSGATGKTTVQVAGKPTSLKLSVNRLVVTTGHTVRLTAHLGSLTTNRKLTIYATPYQGQRRQVASGDVDSSGNLTATFTVVRRTLFSVRFGGDDAYAPATARRLVRARASLREHLQGAYGRSGGYRLYHPGTNPSVFVQVLPRRKGMCLHFRAQHYYSHGWHNSAVSPCLRTNSDGQHIGVLTGNHVVGEPYRVRAEWPGSRALLARSGVWLKLKFHR